MRSRSVMLRNALPLRQLQKTIAGELAMLEQGRSPIFKSLVEYRDAKRKQQQEAEQEFYAKLESRKQAVYRTPTSQNQPQLQNTTKFAQLRSREPTQDRVVPLQQFQIAKLVEESKGRRSCYQRANIISPMQFLSKNRVNQERLYQQKINAAADQLLRRERQYREFQVQMESGFSKECEQIYEELQNSTSDIKVDRDADEASANNSVVLRQEEQESSSSVKSGCAATRFILEDEIITKGPPYDQSESDADEANDVIAKYEEFEDELELNKERCFIIEDSLMDQEVVQFLQQFRVVAYDDGIANKTRMRSANDSAAESYHEQIAGFAREAELEQLARQFSLAPGVVEASSIGSEELEYLSNRSHSTEGAPK